MSLPATMRHEESLNVYFTIVTCKIVPDVFMRMKDVSGSVGGGGGWCLDGDFFREVLRSNLKKQQKQTDSKMCKNC